MFYFNISGQCVTDNRICTIALGDSIKEFTAHVTRSQHGKDGDRCSFTPTSWRSFYLDAHTDRSLPSFPLVFIFAVFKVCISQMITTSVCVASLSQVVRTLYQLLLLTNSKRPWFSHHDWWTIFTHPTKAEIVFSFFTQEVTLRRDLRRSCKSEGRALSHCYLLHTRAFRNVTDLWLLLPCAPQSPRGISVLNNTVV